MGNHLIHSSKMKMNLELVATVFACVVLCLDAGYVSHKNQSKCRTEYMKRLLLMNSSARTLTSKSVAMYHSSAVFLRLRSYVKPWTCRSVPLDTNVSVLIARRTNV